MKPVILLIEDEVDLLGVLHDAIALRLPAYRPVVSTSVQHAEEALSELEDTESLSLVVADHHLGGPGRDLGGLGRPDRDSGGRTGLDFLEEIKERYPGVPTVLLTGQAPVSVEERAAATGTRVLWKPIRLAQWIGEVEDLLGPA
jgi:CheY-like chemotaxis protein